MPPVGLTRRQFMRLSALAGGGLALPRPLRALAKGAPLSLTQGKKAEHTMTAPMRIDRNGSRASIKGPDKFFTGDVRIDPLFEPTEPSRVSAAQVTFEPGARTAWHTHPLGQHLIVTSGRGWTQCEGGPKKEILAGDVVFCNCGQKHWHGATDTTAMSHIAVQEYQDGSPVTWLEHVSDEHYMSPVVAD
ncbi:cupin domain-containing protein [Oleiagrimonas sp. C23AA]|uniref:(R)-mandelonitrile lyase n=1 Tax=Oleiagrimonas sp. C23AA TaxID=2719047 RepID=UPI00141FB1AC|nr:cupin domain-containing protein [Oleiagrimonas sp. C23AA]NII10965.1 cupin domain-containing protein [Oleiagrimonas sp. C23AA]